jgi:tryptophan synthase alpha chain
MSRIKGVFDKLAREQRRALIPYVTAGDPFADITVDLMLGLARAGADVIELGVPFSDPMADGPVIQRASERALAAGIGMPQVLAMVREFRLRDAATPVVLMGYANPIERYGIDRFVDAAHGAGVDGVLVVDYPPEECEPFVARLKAAQMDPIFLLAPTSTDVRMAAVGRMASGYVYYVSLKGVTGAGHLDTAAVAAMVPRIKSHVRLPVGVGFGIRDAESAAAVGRVADAVVIGSRIIQLIENESRERVVAVASDFAGGIRKALDRLPSIDPPRQALRQGGPA